MQHNVDTAFLTAIGAVKATPAFIMRFPALCAGLCVPFMIACDRVANSRSSKLVVRVRVRVWVSLQIE
jgi:hypothetical protein